MTPEEINAGLAVEVMGWRNGDRGQAHYVTREEATEGGWDKWRAAIVRPWSDWNPTSDLNHTRMCEEALSKKEFADYHSLKREVAIKVMTDAGFDGEWGSPEAMEIHDRTMDLLLPLILARLILQAKRGE